MDFLKNIFSKKQESLSPQSLQHCLLCIHPATDRRPHLFPDCRHVFCRDCIQVDSELTLGDTPSGCPICQLEGTPIARPVPPAYPRVRVEVVERSEKVKCVRCSRQTATWLCTTCNQDLCQGCCRHHEAQQREHLVQQCVPQLRMTCRHHRGRDIDVYCSQCQVPVCRKCVDKGHQGHDLEDVSSTANVRARSLRGVERCLEDVTSQRLAQLEQLNQLWSERELERSKAEHSIRRQCDLAVNELRQRQEELLSQLHRQHNQAEKMMNDLQEHLRYRVLCVRKLKLFVSQLKQTGLEPLLLLHSDQVLQRISHLKSDRGFREEEGLLQQLRKVSAFIPATEQWGLGHLDTTTITMPDPAQPAAAQAGHQVPVDLLPRSKLLWSIPPFLGIGGRSKPTGVLYLNTSGEEEAEPSSLLLVAEHDSGQIQFVDCEGNYRSDLVVTDPKQLLAPNDVVINHEGTLLMTDDRELCVKVKQLEQETLSLFCKREYSNFASPFGITVQQDDSIVVTDFMKHSLTHFSPSAQIIRRFESKSRESFPMFVATDSFRQRLLVSEYGNHCVKVYDSQGHKALLTVGKLGSGDGELSSPTGLCVDSQGNILVADSMNHRVSYFHSSGRFLQHLLHFEPGEISPYSLALNQEGQLAITDKLSDKILCYQVFDK